MSIATVVTRGYGTFGSIAGVILRGYSVGSIAPANPWTPTPGPGISGRRFGSPSLQKLRTANPGLAQQRIVKPILN